jgi:GNAT superfamily N-acetyltransferase
MQNLSARGHDAGRAPDIGRGSAIVAFGLLPSCAPVPVEGTTVRSAVRVRPLTPERLYSYELSLDQPPPVLLADDDPSAFLYETGGRLLRGRHLVGRFRLYYADLDAALNARCGADEVLDTYGHTYEFAELVLNRGGSLYSERLERLLGDDLLPGNILILDRLEIRPRYRGRGLGLAAILRLIQRFSAGTQLIALKAFPLQFEYGALDASDAWTASMGLRAFPRVQKGAASALRRYYSRLGFVSMPRTEFMFRRSDARLPTLAELSDERQT